MMAFKWRYLAIGLAIAVGGRILYAMSVPIDSDPVAYRRNKTRVIVDMCHQEVLYWSKQNKRAPTTAEGLPVLGLKVALPRDGYGRPLVYRHDDTKSPMQFVLYSLGPNGVDENGAGDDVSYRE
jgi:hypothetical protein